VTGALDIGRRHASHSFDEDYVQNLRHLLFLRVTTRFPLHRADSARITYKKRLPKYPPQVPIVVFTDAVTHAKLKPYLHSRSIVQLVEVTQLPTVFPYWAQVETIRSSSGWRQQQSASNPASRPYYNAVVMMKSVPTLCSKFSHHLIVAGCFGYVLCLVKNRSAPACLCGSTQAFAPALCSCHFDSNISAFDRIDFLYL
jgi:hypothetical protein